MMNQLWHVPKNYIEGTLIMCAFNEIITAAIELMTLPVLTLLFVVLLYNYGFLRLLKWFLTPDQRLNSTGYRRRKIPDIKTSRSKPKKSTSALVQLNDTIIKDTDTAQLQVSDGKFPIFNSCESKSSTTLYNIESDSKQKMEHQREEDNFITVLSKRERRSLQHKNNQQQKNDEEQQLMNQQKQKQQQHHMLLQNQNDFPTINNIVVTPINPILAENNAWAKALQTKDDNKAKILNAEQKITESECVDKQKHSEKEQELEKQHKLKKQQQKSEERQQLEEKRKQNNQKKQEKPSKPVDKERQKNSKQEKEPEKQCDDAMNEKCCKNHNTIIEELREENEKLRMQYESSKNNWTDIEFKTVLEGVRAEIEIKRLDAIKSLFEKHQTAMDELRSEHEAEIKGLHLFYQTRLNDLQLDHGLAVRAIHTNHAIEVNDLRNIIYGQNQRHGTAMQSLRDVHAKVSKEHQDEVRKYENTIKDQEIRIKTLIEEKELCAQEKLVRELSEKNIDQHHITIEPQITNEHNDKDVDIRTATIADDDTVDTMDMLNNQNLTTLQ
ncbi:nucleoporin GLE1-like [Aphis craccivora]|uniref:Nucleoporin GLE1-like n=1 Tax=Aphis craccivora TaxID=307492 RepID=A0A6G0Y926_APHCR|nr:nucleoporin GLE1-like [Aphis craccivora]